LVPVWIVMVFQNEAKVVWFVARNFGFYVVLKPTNTSCSSRSSVVGGP